MLTYLPIAAATEASHAAVESSNLLDRFGIELGYVIWQLVSFTILATVLYKFAIKPILSTVDDRNTKIEAGLKNAESTAAKLAEAQNIAAAQVKEAQHAASKIIDDARKTAKELSDREAAASIERGNALIVKAQQAIELEHKKMLAEARSEIARLVIVTTERVLAKQLSDADRSRYNEAAARELTSV